MLDLISLKKCAREEGGKAQAGKKAAALVVEPGEADVQLACKVCGAGFAFGVSEQKRYAHKGWAEPSRCLACRKTKRAAVASGSERW